MTAPRAASLLERGLDELGLAAEPGVVSLDAYIRELERWNDKFGLVNATGEDLVVRHILDSLAGLRAVRELLGARGIGGAERAGTARGSGNAERAEAAQGSNTAERAAPPVLADLGTGGGLPGIPLACFLPEARVVLVERAGKKCGFLRGAVLAARVRNAEVVNADYARLTKAFDVVVFRAFSPLTNELVRNLVRMLEPGGAVCAWKGRGERVREEIDSLSKELVRDLSIEAVAVDVPFLEEERNLVILTRAGGS